MCSWARPRTCMRRGRSNGEPVRDGLLWQLGEPRAGDDRAQRGGRLPGIAQHDHPGPALDFGLLGCPVWTSVGAVLHIDRSPLLQKRGRARAHQRHVAELP
jgi:hypothetical protein